MREAAFREGLVFRGGKVGYRWGKKVEGTTGERITFPGRVRRDGVVALRACGSLASFVHSLPSAVCRRVCSACVSANRSEFR